MSEVHRNVWKYSTIGLLAVLAVGFSFPQAYSDVKNNVLHMVLHIYEDTQAIKAKTNSLPTDPASNSHIDEAIASIPSGVTQEQYQTLKCNAVIRSHVDLTGCKLEFGRFPNADLNKANLTDADLHGALLSNADLREAVLRDAFLRGTNFSGAQLQGADFTGANLEGASLANAQLTFANFQDADLTVTDFTGCIGTPLGTPAAGTLPTCS